MGSQFTYVGSDSALALLNKQNTSFALVLEKTLVNKVKAYAEGLRDLDVLQEQLSNKISLSFYNFL